MYSKTDRDSSMARTSRRREAYSKRLARMVITGDILLSAATLGLCALAILRDYTGSMAYLTALIGVYNAATGYVLGRYMDKSKAENTKGGIVFETAMNEREDRDF